MMRTGCLAKVANQSRSETIGNPEGQTPPQGDEGAVLGIQGVVLGYGIPLEEAVLIRQRSRLETPVLLEAERPGAGLAAAIVENATPPGAGVAHQLPVLEIIGGEIPRGQIVPA